MERNNEELQSSAATTSKSSFSIVLICTKSRRIPARASANHGAENGGSVVLICATSRRFPASASANQDSENGALVRWQELLVERNNEELRSYRDALERRDEENRQGKHTDDRNKQVPFFLAVTVLYIRFPGCDCLIHAVTILYMP